MLNPLSPFALCWISFIKGFPYLSRAQIHIHGIWIGKVFGENANIRHLVLMMHTQFLYKDDRDISLQLIFEVYLPPEVKTLD